MGFDVFTRRCGCGRILARLEQCPQCTAKQREQAVAKAGPRSTHSDWGPLSIGVDHARDAIGERIQNGLRRLVEIAHQGRSEPVAGCFCVPCQAAALMRPTCCHINEVGYACGCYARKVASEQAAVQSKDHEAFEQKLGDCGLAVRAPAKVARTATNALPVDRYGVGIKIVADERMPPGNFALIGATTNADLQRKCDEYMLSMLAAAGPPGKNGKTC